MRRVLLAGSLLLATQVACTRPADRPKAQDERSQRQRPGCLAHSRRRRRPACAGSFRLGCREKSPRGVGRSCSMNDRVQVRLATPDDGGGKDWPSC